MQYMSEGRSLVEQLRKGVIEHCVLAMLTREDMYGFQLVRALGDTDGLVTSEGTIYPLLARLKKDGHVTSTWKESKGGPPRKYYAITAEGSAALETFRSEWRRFSDAVESVVNEGVTE